MSMYVCFMVLFIFLQGLQNHSFRHFARHQKELQKHCYFIFILFLLYLMFWVWAAIPLSPMATLGNPQAVVFQGNACSQHGCHCVHWGAEPKTVIHRSLHLLFLVLLLQRDQGSQEQLLLCDWRRSSVCLKCQCVYLVVLFLKISVSLISVGLYLYSLYTCGVMYQCILKSISLM